MPEMTSRAFSFNSPHGACPACQGLGATYDFDARLVVPDESRSLLGGAIAPWARGDRKLVRDAITTLARTYGIDADAVFYQRGIVAQTTCVRILEDIAREYFLHP